MGKIATRCREKSRAKSPTFCFSTKLLRNEPLPDSAAVRAEKDAKIAAFLEKKREGRG